jgi:hypothetical protein
LPQEALWLTKLVAEKVCDTLAKKRRTQIAILRFAGIYTDAHPPMLRDRKKTPPFEAPACCRATSKRAPRHALAGRPWKQISQGINLSIFACAARSWTVRPASWLHNIRPGLKISAIG